MDFTTFCVISPTCIVSRLTKSYELLANMFEHTSEVHLCHRKQVLNVCMYVCMYVCMCVCVCVYVYMYVCVSVCVYVCMSVYI